MSFFTVTKETKKGGLAVRTEPLILEGFVALNKPSKKYNEDGTYSCRFALEDASPETAELKALFSQVMAKAVEAVKSKGDKPQKAPLPGSPESDEDGNETGRTVYVISQDAVYGDGITFRPIVVDKALQPIPSSVNIGTGSMVRLSFVIRPYAFGPKAGVTLDLQGVQVLDLVKYSGGLSADKLFSAESEGYSVESEDFDSEGTGGQDEVEDADF